MASGELAMTPNEEFLLNTRRLELAEANTADIIQRYDNAEYHRMTWTHEIECKKCEITSVVQADVPKSEFLNVAFCPECELPATLRPFIEIVEFDEGSYWQY